MHMNKFNTSQIKYNHFETMVKKMKILMFSPWPCDHIKFTTKTYSFYIKVNYFVKEKIY